MKEKTRLTIKFIRLLFSGFFFTKSFWSMKIPIKSRMNYIYKNTVNLYKTYRENIQMIGMGIEQKIAYIKAKK